MKEAFIYMFKDKKFWLKGLSYFVLIFIANLLSNYAQTLMPPCPRCAPPLPWQYWVCFITGSLLSLIPLGYIYTCINALVEQNENYVLPFMNPWRNFLKGLKYSVALLLLVVPLFTITMIIVAGIAGLTAGSLVGLIISKTLLILVIGVFAFLLIGFNWIFANKDSFFTFYRFKKVFELIASGKKKYIFSVLLAGIVFAANMIFETILGFGAGVLHLETIAGLIIVGLTASLTGTYVVFVIAYLTAKSINKELVENL